MEFEIQFYVNADGRSPVEDFLFNLGKSNKFLLAKARNGIEKLKYSEYHKGPLSKHIESGLWELRIKECTNILRIFYTFRQGQVIILLHSFIKKKQKTPVAELEIARKRLRELRMREVN